MNDCIKPLAFEDLPDDLQGLLKPTVERLGYFGEYFQAAGHVPASLQTFMAYTGSVKAPLSDDLNEVLALTVCSRLGGDYERIQHERLSRKLGFSLDWIGELTGARRPNPSLLDEKQRAVRALALAMLAGQGRGVERELSLVVQLLGEPAAVAAMLQVTRFVGIAMMNNALAMTLPVPSVFEE